MIRTEKQKIFDHFANGYVQDNTFRWKTNDSVPFEDMLRSFRDTGLISQLVYEVSVAVRKQELTNMLREYADRNKNRQLSFEERCEMRNAFGPGSTVVNVITGDRYTV